MEDLQTNIDFLFNSALDMKIFQKENKIKPTVSKQLEMLAEAALIESAARRITDILKGTINQIEIPES
jgi:hypothetical protein